MSFTKFAVSAILLFSLTGLRAQFVNIPGNFSTPMGNIMVPNYYHFPNHYFGMTTLDGNGYFNTWALYTVRLKNDSSLNVYGEIDMSGKIHSLVVKGKNKSVRKIFPSETKYIAAHSDKLVKAAGIANDSCWLFRQLNDSVSLYSFIPQASTDFCVFFKKPRDPSFFLLDEKNLLNLVGDDEELARLIKKEEDYVKAVKLYNLKLQGR